MASVYVPDELKARLIAAAQAAGYTVGTGAGSELVDFLEYLLNAHVPLSGKEPWQLWDAFRSQIEPLSSALAKALEPHRTAINIAFDADRGQLLVYQRPLEDSGKPYYSRGSQSALSPDAFMALGKLVGELFERLGGEKYEPPSVAEAKLVWRALSQAREILGAQSGTDRMIRDMGHEPRMSSLDLSDIADHINDMAWPPEYPYEKAAPTEERVAAAQFALRLDPDCADAYNALGAIAEEGKDWALAKRHYRHAMRAAIHTIGLESFARDARRDYPFWGSLGTRPYMRGCCNLAGVMARLGELDGAIHYYQQALTLNPNDNQGNRYMLAACLLEAGRLDELAQLQKKHRTNDSLWHYTQAALLFLREGASRKANDRLQQAIAHNPHVPNYLVVPPEKLPEERAYSSGSPDEAIEYAHIYGRAWRKTAGLLDWLVRRMKQAHTLKSLSVAVDDPMQPGNPVHRWTFEAYTLVAPLVTRDATDALIDEDAADRRESDAERRRRFRVRLVLTALPPLVSPAVRMGLLALEEHVQWIDDHIALAVALLPVIRENWAVQVFGRAANDAFHALDIKTWLGYRVYFADLLAVAPAAVRDMVQPGHFLEYLRAHPPERRAPAICALAPYIPAALAPAVLDLARETTDSEVNAAMEVRGDTYPQARVDAMLAAATRLPSAARAALVKELRPDWTKTLGCLREQGVHPRVGYYYRSHLTSIVKSLCAMGYGDEVVNGLVDSIGSGPLSEYALMELCGSTLPALFAGLPRGTSAKVVDVVVPHALRYLEGPPDKGEFAGISQEHKLEAGSALLPCVSDAKTRTRIGQACLRVIEQTYTEPRSRVQADDKSDALCALAPQLPDTLVQPALEHARALYTRPARVRALAALLPRMAPAQQEETRGTVESIINTLREPVTKAEALVALAQGYARAAELRGKGKDRSRSKGNRDKRRE